MRVILFLSYILFSYQSLCAQPPGIDDSIMLIKRKWTQGSSPNVNPDPSIPKNQYSIIYKKIDSIAVLFRQAYPVPTGTEAAWNSDIDGYPLFVGGPFPYEYRAMLKYFYYNTNYKKIIVADETGTWSYVFVNDFGWLLESSKLEFYIDGKKKTVWEIPVEAGSWKGYTMYNSFRGSKSHPQRVVVITKPGKLPWLPISQLQYLKAVREKTEKEKQQTIAQVDVYISASRKNIEDTRNNTYLTKDMKEKLITELQKTLDAKIKSRETDIQKAAAFFDKDLKVIDDYINQTDPAILQTQAITEGHLYFKGKFTDPANPYARRLVYVNQAYFNKSLPGYFPQLMILYWQWNDNAPGRYYREQLEEKFPVEKLQAMIKE